MRVGVRVGVGVGVRARVRVRVGMRVGWGRNGATEGRHETDREPGRGADEPRRREHEVLGVLAAPADLRQETIAERRAWWEILGDRGRCHEA